MFKELREFERPQGGDLRLPTVTPAFCVPVLQQLAYVFLGRPRCIPAMVVAGGVLVDGTPVTGAGDTHSAALVRLAGEAAEQLGLRAVVPGLAKEGPIEARGFAGQTVVQVAREILPVADTETAGFSEGLAAHTDAMAAQRHGALELFERDAAAHWWAGITQAVDLLGVETLVTEVLGARQSRHTRVLDVTCDTGVPVVVAASFDESGSGFCFGAAAGGTLQAAATSALRELGASEFGQLLEQSRGGTAAQTSGALTVETLTLDALDALFVARKVPLETQFQVRGQISEGRWPKVFAANGIGIVDLGCVAGQFWVIKAVSATLQPGRETQVCQRFQTALLGTKRRTQGPLY